MPDGPRRRHPPVVTPAEAGVQWSGLSLDSGFRRNDGRSLASWVKSVTKQFGPPGRTIPIGKEDRC
ncbi:MAG TPA: hypothetical protein VF464_07930, partial [Candidatus Methylomirabilis sp.]